MLIDEYGFHDRVIEMAGDRELREYVDARNASGGRNSYCASLLSTTRPLGTITQSGNVECDNAPRTMDTTLFPASGGWQAGTCRASFNACLGRELELASQSLMSPPPDVQTKLRIMQASRDRLLASAFETTGLLGVYAHHCSGYLPINPGNPEGPQTLPAHQLECERFLGLYSGASLTRPLGVEMPVQLADIVHRVTELTANELRLRATAADAISPPAVLGEGTWISHAWGANSLRLHGARSVYGGGDRLRIESRRTSSGQYRTAAFTPDFELPIASPGNRRVADALALLRSTRAPVGAVRVDGVVRPSDLSAAIGPISDGATAVYRFVDHRLAAAQRVGPYSSPSVTGDLLRSNAVVPFADFQSIAATSLAADISPLQTQRNLSVEDFRHALRVAADQVATLHADYTTREVIASGGGAPALLAADLDAATSRELEILTNSLGRTSYPPGVLTANPYADILNKRMGWPTLNGRPVTHDYYDLGTRDPAVTVPGPSVYRFSRMGTAGALHVLRVHFARIAAKLVPPLRQHEINLSSPWRERYGAIATSIEQSLTSARSIIDKSVGIRFTEWDRQGELTVACVDPANTYIAGHNAWYSNSRQCEYRHDRLSDRGHWDLYYSLEGGVDPYTTGAAYTTTSLDVARCWTDGHVVGEASTTCAALTPLTQVDATPADVGFGGLLRRRYVLMNPQAFAEHDAAQESQSKLFVLWVKGIGSDQIVELLDVIEPRESVAVHTHGGDFASLVDELFERDLGNPSRAPMTSLGLPWDFAPPLENDLVVGPDDRIEDSYERYLARFEELAHTAKQRFDEAQRMELEAVTNARRDAASLALSRHDYATEIAALCGGSPSDEAPCSLARGTPTPQLLGLLPPAVPWDAACTEFLRTFYENLPDLETEFAELSEYLERGLYCSYAQVIHESASLTFPDLPDDVTREFRFGGNGQFPRARGELQALHVELFEAMTEARRSAREMEVTSITAASRLEEATEIDEYIQDQTKRRRAACIVGSIGTFVARASEAASTAVSSHQKVSGAERLTHALDVPGTQKAYESTLADQFNRSFQDALSAVTVLGTLISGGCEADENAQNDAHFASLVAVARAMQDFERHSVQLTALNALIASASTYYDRMEAQAEDARSRRALLDLTTSSNEIADVPAWHVLRTARTRHAQDAMLRAQRAGVVARRAIELRLGDELSLLTAPEPFVPGPATWLGQIFTIPHATEGNPPVSRSGSALREYAQFLRDFVHGYPVARRFQDATDRAVIELPAVHDMTRGESIPFWQTLDYKCWGSEELLRGGREPGSSASSPCATLGGVEYAQLEFSASTRADTYFASRIASGSFNYRHERFGLNVVGFSVFNCALASHPWECSTNGYIDYSIRQAEEVAFENFDRETVSFFLEPGVANYSRALANERALGSPVSSGDGSYMEPYMRRELRGRPLVGKYTVVLHGRPEIIWERIESIQMLLDYRYWTRQE